MKNFFENANNSSENQLELTKLKLGIPTEIPAEMPEGFSHNNIEFQFGITSLDFDSSFRARELYLKAGMVGFVSWRWVIPFVNWINGRKCLEIMSGRGWLSHALKLKDVDVIATDNFSWHKRCQTWDKTLTDIEEIDAVQAIKKYGSEVDIVICSWPKDDNTAFKSLKKLNEINPNAVFVFIGEAKTATCADVDFYEHYKLIEDEKFQLVVEKYQSWIGLPERLCVGKFE
ncbi:hypothetical protein [Priestia aryabhattai]